MSTATRPVGITDTLPGIAKQYMDHVRMFMANQPSSGIVSKEDVQASFLETLPDDLRIDPDKAAHAAELDRFNKARKQLGYCEVPPVVIPSDDDRISAAERPAFYAIQMELPYAEFVAAEAKDWKASLADQEAIRRATVDYVERHPELHLSVRNVLRDIRNAAK
jgi:hypothetical protein